jgi:hypothetical protein
MIKSLCVSANLYFKMLKYMVPYVPCKLDSELHLEATSTDSDLDPNPDLAK